MNRVRACSAASGRRAARERRTPRRPGPLPPDQRLNYVPPAQSRPGLLVRLFLGQALAALLLTAALTTVQTRSSLNFTQEQFGQRALVISRTVAELPEVIAALRTPSGTPARPDGPLNLLANRIRARDGAAFVVIADRRGVRLSHPDPAQVGRPLTARGDPEPAEENLRPLHGQEVLGVATGTLGRSVRGKVPVRGPDGQVIGLVSTGFLLPTVRAVAAHVSAANLPWIVLALGLAFAVSALQSWRYKRANLNLEPEQVSALVRQQQIILDALHEGVLVTGRGGRILLLNPRAAELLGVRDLQAASVEVAGAWPELWRSGLLALDHDALHTPLRLGSVPVLASVHCAPGGQRVVTLRDRAEVTRMLDELSQVQHYRDVLRAQTHEFMNRLHTIAGLIQLGRPDEALDVIEGESQRHTLLQQQLRDLPLTHLAALVLGKSARARELGVAFALELPAGIRPVWNQLGPDVLVPVVGNLLENAFEAARLGGHPPQVWLALTEDGAGLHLEVRDNGAGLPPELAGRVFERGFSTRGEQRGFGLSLVRERVASVGGTVSHRRRAGRTVFQVSLPGEAVRTR